MWPSSLRLRARSPDYCIGLPKCGTHSIAELFAPVLHCAHEPGAEALIDLMVRERSGTATAREVRRALRKHARRGQLDLECSHLFGEFISHLVALHPRARFILLVRRCEPWLDSMINDQINLRRWSRYPRWKPLYDHYFGGEDREFPEAEHRLQALDLYPLRNYLRYWRASIERARACVPPQRLLVVDIRQLAANTPRLAEFLGVPAMALPHTRSHAYATTRKHHVLRSLPAAHVRGVIESECGELQQQLFG